MATPDLQHRFAYHSPKDDATVKAHEQVRYEIGDTARVLDELLPDGREKALAFTKLEEAMMWANAAIARHGAGSPAANRASDYSHGSSRASADPHGEWKARKVTDGEIVAGDQVRIVGSPHHGRFGAVSRIDAGVLYPYTVRIEGDGDHVSVYSADELELEGGWR